ncbi:TPA: hypothetical protein ACOENV_001229 [Stenotrophomonas maltophilia]|uniref:hypothetical protein n=1 Tax=Stenotrophomonas maltophilia TaxID=40324 RepID=UPI001FA8198C|nr:hypothetical protein [Stenotrophomonas maltophilia]
MMAAPSIRHCQGAARNRAEHSANSKRRRRIPPATFGCLIGNEVGEPTISVGGIATFDGALQYSLAVTTGGDPVVTSEKTGRRWMISWPNLVRLAVADGIDQEGA